jgi:hypothetical protein
LVFKKHFKKRSKTFSKTMQFFINELSLHNQFYNANDFEEAVKQFTELFTYINEKIQDKKLYKEEILFSRNTFLSKPFTAAFEQIKSRDLKEKFRRTVFNRSNPKDWRTEQVHNADEIYICPLCTENDGLVSDTSLAEATERYLLNPNSAKYYLIVNFKASRFASFTHIPIIKNDIQNVDLQHFENKNDFEDWLKAQKITRKFNKNNKHGENGKGAHSKNKDNNVAILYCNITEAQTLLDTAISSPSPSDKRLYNFDTKNQKFIVFHFEGDTVENQYHGFHIEPEEAKKDIYRWLHKRFL